MRVSLMLVKELFMNHPWYTAYQTGVPHTIDPNQYVSLNELFLESVQKYATRNALEFMGSTMTYQELYAKSLAFAAFLQSLPQFTPQCRIALMMPNCLQYPVALFGTLLSGATVVNVNPLYTAEELKGILQDSGAQVIVVLAQFAHVVEAILPQTMLRTVIVTKVPDLLSTAKRVLINTVLAVKRAVPAYYLPHCTFPEILAAGAKLRWKDPELNHESIAFLQYTGGTTGKSKAAVLTHRNMIANVLQAGAWIEPIRHRLEGHGAIITALPLYHIFSLTANCLTFLRFGISNRLIINPRDFKQFIKELKRGPFCAITGVNTLFNALLLQPDFKTVDFSHLAITLGGGMAVQQAVAQKWKAVTGNVLIEAYGLTETSPAACINPFNITEYNGSIGTPLPSTEVMICDDEGKEQPIGSSGELWIRGPQVMREYWHNPAETKNVLTPEGWLKTGDIATLDSRGFVRIVDRKKDMILVSGFNVYPNEIEDILVRHPHIQEAAVIGVPYSATGEAVKAYIVTDGTPVSIEEIMIFCEKYLTHYKLPKLIEFRESLPKTNVGKILRRALKAEMANETSERVVG